MEDHTYKVIELVGASSTSVEDAVQNAISRASRTLHDLRWFQLIETRAASSTARSASTKWC